MTTSPTERTELQNTSDTTNDNNRTTSAEKKFSLTLSEGILLAIGSSAAYLLTFQYEKGFASYFGIPPQFVSVGLLNVLYGAVLLLAFIYVVFSFGNLSVAFIPTKYSVEPVFVRRILELWITLLPDFAVAYLHNNLLWWLLFVVGALLLVFAGFVLPLFRNKTESSYIKKLEAEERKKQKTAGTPNLLSLTVPKFGPKLSLILWYSLMSIFLAAAAGESAAESQKEFLVTTIAPTNEVVLLRRYGDELIFAPFDRKTFQVQKTFLVVKVQDLKTLLILESIGPLKPVNSTHDNQMMPTPSPQASPTP